MKHHLLLCTIAVFFLFLLTNDVSSGKSYRKLKYCKVDNAIECGIEPNTMFTSTENGSGIVNSQSDMEQFCFNQVDYIPICIKQWMNRCAGPVHSDVVFRVFINPMGEAMKIFCDKEGPIRNEFLKYSNCLIHHVKLSPSYRRQCIRPLQAAGEFIHNRAMDQLRGPNRRPDLRQFLRATCCAYNKWENCILDHLTQNCGKPSADIFPYLIHQGSLDILRFLCNNKMYNPEDPTQCKKEEFIAPESYRPVGLTSTSLVSYIFSYSCPNVGWGIVPERDW